MAAGWTKIDGESCYFLPESGKMASGCCEIEDNTYYFSPKTGEMLTGWQNTERGTRAYWVPETGKQTATRAMPGSESTENIMTRKRILPDGDETFTRLTATLFRTKSKIFLLRECRRSFCAQDPYPVGRKRKSCDVPGFFRKCPAAVYGGSI